MKPGTSTPGRPTPRKPTRGRLALGMEGLARLAPRAFGTIVAIGAVGGLILDVEAADYGPGPELLNPALFASVIAALCLLLGKRRRSLGLAITVSVGLLTTAAVLQLELLSFPGFTEMGALCVLVAGTVRRAKPPVALLGAAAVLVDTSLATLRASDDMTGGGLLGNTIVIWFPMVVAIGVGLFMRYQDEAAWRASSDARSEERLNLARELHDSIAHHITGIVVQAQAAQIAVAQRGDGEIFSAGPDDVHTDVVRDALVSIERSGAETMGSMRRFVSTLRAEGDAPLAPTSGLAELRELVADVSSVGPPVTMDLDDSGIPPDIAPSLYRVVQESLTNVRRHAPGTTTATVQIRRQGDGIIARVVNDGPTVGVPPTSRRPGFGLEGLRERMQALDGELSAGPLPDGGWQVSVWLPVRP